MAPSRVDAAAAQLIASHRCIGGRFQSLVIYGQRTHADGHAHAEGPGHTAGHGRELRPTHTLAVVDSMTSDDLRACAVRVGAWHEAGLATPLLIADHEFEQSLDAFPLEFGAILSDHSVVAGANPFESLTVDPADLRRACEVQARSHLLHLREGYLETRRGSGCYVARDLPDARPTPAPARSTPAATARATSRHALVRTVGAFPKSIPASGSPMWRRHHRKHCHPPVPIRLRMTFGKPTKRFGACA